MTAAAPHASDLIAHAVHEPAAVRIVDIGETETEAVWTAFLRNLLAAWSACSGDRIQG